MGRLDYGLGWLQRKTKVRLGDLTFSGTHDDDIYGIKKVPIIDEKLQVTDGNHRLYKLIQEEGEDYAQETWKTTGSLTGPWFNSHLDQLLNPNSTTTPLK